MNAEEEEEKEEEELARAQCAGVPEEDNMEVFVCAPSFRFSKLVFADGSAVRDVLLRYTQLQGVSSEDFYVSRNGRLTELQDALQQGAVYRLEPRLRGGKGGFGSMLRALGAQIEKTTNREACRDLSGRRLRDVNHEKEMAEWLKKQAEREAEKEQRRLERLQRKLAEPKHQFTDAEYQQQCHDLSERLEDSVLKGLQVSSSSQVKADDVSAAKRPNSDDSEQPEKKKKKKKKTTAAAAACFWTGVGELLSSEDEEEDEEDERPSASSSGCGAAAAAVAVTTQLEEDDESPSSSSSCGAAVAVTTQTEEAEPDQSGSCSTSSSQTIRPSEDQKPPETSRPSEDQKPPETSRRSEESSCSQQPRRVSAVDLSSLSSPQQLESLGLDVLKEELMSRGLKCGGTLAERAARLFSVRGLTAEQIDPALLAKPGKSKRK
ncbi:replication stress response regulator SDE2 isoform X2 [Thunnus maccoyii]|uniref:replication stress response regulator SDE2 isoform X2 n=1 Tax=Thunnus maccoyii TaxID=8240 RepID=UPI001C4C786D|nr:replication stress response regulator SDE2 isoform X2 [Thunnus maccoyii]